MQKRKQRLSTFIRCQLNFRKLKFANHGKWITSRLEAILKKNPELSIEENQKFINFIYIKRIHVIYVN